MKIEVELTGFYTVEADSLEEAEKKARQYANLNEFCANFYDKDFHEIKEMK